MASPAAIPVADPDDERLLPYRALSDKALRPRVDSELGVFVVEGHLALEQLVGSQYSTVSVLVAPNRLQPLAGLLSRVEAPVYVAERAVIAATVGFDLHRGVVAVGRRPVAADPAALVASGNPLLVLEGINDHENLGALFRTARAFGAAGVLLDPTCADPLYRRSIRVSLGHVLRVPFARLAPWPEALSGLAHAGYLVVALTPDASAAPVERAMDEARGGRPVAVLVGAEGPGLSAGARAAAGTEARIAMAPGVDSLNVASAAAIALHRLFGQGLG